MADFNGGIGLNEERLHNDIRTFRDGMIGACDKLLSVSDDFFSGLKDKWASPDAKAKSFEWGEKLKTVCDNILNDYTVSVDIVEDAAGYIAKSLGTFYKRLFDDIGMDYHGMGFNNLGKCLGAFSDGTIAMDVNAVKLLLDLFNQGIDEVYSLMDAVSDSINIYDANGDIQNGHSCKIKEIKQELTDEVKAINTELQSYMDQYITGVENAKAQAASGF